MMAWRIAYCKVNYPLAYYAAFYSIRADCFSYELMCQGKEHLEAVLADYNRRKDELSKKEQDSIRDLRIVQEMYARGFEFMPIDIYKAFEIVPDHRRQDHAIPRQYRRYGDKAAEAMMEAAKDGPFLSRDDLRSRSKAPQNVIDKMGELGLLGSLPQSNQLSLFDFM